MFKIAKLFTVVLVLILALAGVAFADNGVSTGNKTYTMLSTAAVATGATVTSSAVTFDNPMNAIACDVILSSTTATGTFQIEGNAGSSGTSFTAANMMSAVTVTANQLNTYWVTGKPVRTMRVVYKNVAGVGAAYTVTSNCLGVQ